MVALWGFVCYKILVNWMWQHIKKELYIKIMRFTAWMQDLLSIQCFKPKEPTIIRWTPLRNTAGPIPAHAMILSSVTPASFWAYSPLQYQIMSLLNLLSSAPGISLQIAASRPWQCQCDLITWFHSFWFSRLFESLPVSNFFVLNQVWCPLFL